MLLLFKRGDAEGYYRRHWLLMGSLEIYFLKLFNVIKVEVELCG
jgi:hypothetical protein